MEDGRREMADGQRAWSLEVGGWSSKVGYRVIGSWEMEDEESQRPTADRKQRARSCERGEFKEAEVGYLLIRNIKKCFPQQ